MIDYLETLGCSRNQVDSEIMLGRLAAAGWTFTDAPEQADTIVVNTCSFITPAAEESRARKARSPCHRHSGIPKPR